MALYWTKYKGLYSIQSVDSLASKVFKVAVFQVIVFQVIVFQELQSASIRNGGGVVHKFPVAVFYVL